MSREFLDDDDVLDTRSSASVSVVVQRWANGQSSQVLSWSVESIEVGIAILGLIADARRYDVDHAAYVMSGYGVAAILHIYGDGNSRIEDMQRVREGS